MFLEVIIIQKNLSECVKYFYRLFKQVRLIFTVKVVILTTGLQFFTDIQANIMNIFSLLLHFKQSSYL